MGEGNANSLPKSTDQYLMLQLPELFQILNVDDVMGSVLQVTIIPHKVRTVLPDKI